MGGGPRPPAVDLVKVVKKTKNKVVLKGTNANEGYKVTVTRQGKAEYFLSGETIKVTFEPQASDPGAPSPQTGT